MLLSPADWLPHIIGALCVSVPMFLLCLVIDGAFGGGDIKLMAAAGLFLGWQNTLLAMFFGIVFGGIYGIYLLAAKKAGKKDHFAFGPFLCVGHRDCNAVWRARFGMVLRVFVMLLASLCEGGGPAGPEGENLATNRNISVCRRGSLPHRLRAEPPRRGGQGNQPFIYFFRRNLPHATFSLYCHQ